MTDPDILMDDPRFTAAMTHPLTAIPLDDDAPADVADLVALIAVCRAMLAGRVIVVTHTHATADAVADAAVGYVRRISGATVTETRDPECGRSIRITDAASAPDAEIAMVTADATHVRGMSAATLIVAEADAVSDEIVDECLPAVARTTNAHVSYIGRRPRESRWVRMVRTHGVAS